MSEKFGYEFIQISVHSREAPPPLPETFDACAKQGEATNGVMTMMDIIVA